MSGLSTWGWHTGPFSGLCLQGWNKPWPQYGTCNMGWFCQWKFLKCAKLQWDDTINSVLLGGRTSNNPVTKLHTTSAVHTHTHTHTRINSLYNGYNLYIVNRKKKTENLFLYYLLLKLINCYKICHLLFWINCHIVTHFPLHLNNVSTLPCERKFCICDVIFSHFDNLKIHHLLKLEAGFTYWNVYSFRYCIELVAVGYVLLPSSRL